MLRMLKSMGMVKSTARHWNRMNNQEVAVQEKVSRKGHILDAVSTSFRAFMQVLIYCMGAFLAIKNEVGMGAIIAASIIMGACP